MFLIKVNSAFYMKHIDTVVIGGEVTGSIKNGAVLVDKDNPQNEYTTKGVVLVDDKDKTYSDRILDIQLIPGNYLAEELIGRTLVNKD